MSQVWLHHLTWEEFREALERVKVVVIPIGSVEQHGTHLPLGTDTFVASALAEDAAEKAGAIVIPPIWYGWSPHHMAFPGTITLRAEILIEVLYDILSSLARHGTRRFVILNGHRIVNIPWVQIACDRAQNTLGVRTVIFDPAYMSKTIVDDLGFGPLGHAEEIESSHMWYRYPESYRKDKVHDYVHSKDTLFSVDPRFPGDTLCYVPTSLERAKETAPVSKGVSGRPSLSSPEKGKIYHEHLVQKLVEVIEYLRDLKH